MNKSLEIAKDRAGGASGLARLLGRISPQAVSQWTRVPAERVIEVERVTGVSRYELRPDIYPPHELPFRSEVHGEDDHAAEQPSPFPQEAAE
jgi:DNA-binding transcriptional regulator YdaS (Cro superfamily)